MIDVCRMRYEARLVPCSIAKKIRICWISDMISIFADDVTKYNYDVLGTHIYIHIWYTTIVVVVCIWYICTVYMYILYIIL